MGSLRNLWLQVAGITLVVLTALVTVLPAHADWAEVTEPAVEVSQSNPFFDRRSRTYFSTVTVTNNSPSALVGELRVVVDSANKTAQNPDGTTPAGEPFYYLLSGAGAELLAGQSVTATIGFVNGRGRLVFSTRLEINPPVVAEPGLGVNPAPLELGDLFVGSTGTGLLTISNIGDADLNVTDIQSSGAPFSVFPPTSFTIATGGTDRLVSVGFAPLSEGDFTGTITVASNAGPATVTVNGRGVLPILDGDIDAPDSLGFGSAQEQVPVEQSLTISNTGDGPLTVSDAISDNPDFEVLTSPGNDLPFTLNPDESRNLGMRFTPPVGSGGTTVTGNLTILSDDPDEVSRVVALSGNSVPVPLEPLVNNPILGALVDDVITAANCGNVSGEVQFGAGSSSSDNFQVTLTDQGGVSALSGFFAAANDAGVLQFDGIDACALGDGVIDVSVVLGSLPGVAGIPAVKNTSSLPAPLLDPVQPVTVFSVIEVCGTSRESTTVRIEGGANVVSITLDASTTDFCLNVPLRSNTQNTLIAAAIDGLASAPRPVASAQPVQIVHVDPSEIVVAEATSRPLTTEEIETLVQNGVINLDDPSNFNVSMFTVVLTIGSFPPVSYTQPVPVPTTPGTIGYGGGGGSGGGGWGTGGSGVPSGSPCVTGCSQIVVIPTPTGQTIPGIIIIDGRIKTLKEFFQITIAIQNTSIGFNLSDMQASIDLPAGLSPVRAGPGTNVADVNVSGEVDNVDIGEIGPGETGTGQFIIRGDGIGTHNVDVDFGGFLTGGGLPDPFPVNGTASTSVQVYGPPELGVVVRHPSDPAGPDVALNEIYELIVEITNLSPRPALYTSLELFVGGDAELVDALGNPIPDSNEIRSFGHIQPGQTVAAAFRVNPLVEGEIIACQAIASENISLTVDTGPDGTDCNIANTYPANFVPLPANMPPTVIGINPLNGQPNIPVTSSVLATLTPQSACIVQDTWTNVVTGLIDPLDPGKGLKVISADLVDAGTFYLEELDAFGHPVRHIPTDLTVEDPPAGGTTIAVLRLGLDAPHPNSQFFLSPNATYRATLVGGPGGVCSAASSAEMENSFSWTFSTEQTCGGIDSPIASLFEPTDGSINRPLNQAIVLDFSNRMDPASFAFNPADLSASTFGAYQNALESGGEISGGSPIPGSGVFSNLNRTLTYTPLANLPEDTVVHVRLTDGLRDVCGNPLQTPPNGVRLFSFQTTPPDTIAPDVPLVNVVPALTNLATVQVSGTAEANSEVEVSGGTAVANTTASAAGLFSIPVALELDQSNTLQVQATDASGNASGVATIDVNGDPLVVTNDSTLPSVLTTTPPDAAFNVSRTASVDLFFDEPIRPETVNDLNFTLEGAVVVPGSFTLLGDSGFMFTPDDLLGYNTTYTVRMRAGGVRDLAGNGITSDFVASFTTEDFALPVLASVIPDSGVQGTNFQVTFSGTELATADSIISDNSGITGSIVTATDDTVVASISIDSLAVPGLTTLGLTTLGGSASVAFTVLHKAPVISAIVPSSGDQGATVAAQIQGSGLTDISSINIDGSGVVVNDLGTGDDTVRDVEFVIDAAAPIGIRNVTVATPGGADGATFTVLGFVPLAPDVTSVTPDSGEQGSSLQVTFNGSNLSGANAVVSSNPDITGSIVSATDTGVVADIVIDAAAALGVTELGVSSPSGSDTVTFTVNTPLDVITLTPSSINLLTFDSEFMNVAIDTLAGAGGQIIDLSSSNSSIASVPASVIIPEGGNSVSFEVTTGSTAGTAQISASAAGFSGDSSPANVSARGMSLDLFSPLIGVGRSIEGSVVLAQQAPSGGVTVSLASGNTDVATVTPASVFIAAGATGGSFTIDGLLVGTTPITASASGFSDASEDIVVTSTNVVNFGLIPDVAPGQSVSLPTSLGQPAPAGGVTINFTSSDPTVASVTPSVFIPEGLQVPAANPQVTGILIGSVQITGIATGFAPDIRPANVTLDMNFSLATLNIIESETKNITLQISAPAPAGGLTINLSTDDSGIATAPVSVIVGVGETSAQVAVTGVAVGSTTLSANSPGVNEATATVNVNPQPAINIGDVSVGKDLQTGLSGSLGAPAPAGHLQVTLTSSDPTRVLLSTDRTTAGSESITVQVNSGSASIPAFYVQSLTDTGIVSITASAPGYATDTSSVTSAPSGFWLNAGDFTRDVFAANVNLQLRTARLNPTTLNFAAHEELRAGQSVSVDLTNSDDAVGTLTVDPVVFTGGAGVAQNTAFDPVSAGATTIALVQPAGFDVPANVPSSIVATVTAPSINIGNVTVGKDLQTSTFISLSNAPPSPVDVTVTIAAGSVALISTDRTTVGSSSVTFSGVTSTSVGTIYVQGLAIGSTQITVQAAAYNDDTGSVTVDPSGFWLNAGDFTRDVFAANVNLQLRTARLNPTTLNFAAHEELRAGQSVSVDLTNSDDAVGTLTVDPVVFTGGAGVAQNTAFDPVSAGATTIALVQPAGFDVPANVPSSITATVTE